MKSEAAAAAMSARSPDYPQPMDSDALSSPLPASQPTSSPAAVQPMESTTMNLVQPIVSDTTITTTSTSADTGDAATTGSKVTWSLYVDSQAAQFRDTKVDSKSHSFQ